MGSTVQCKTCGVHRKPERTPKERAQRKKLAQLQKRQAKLETELEDNLLKQHLLRQQLGITE